MLQKADIYKKLVNDDVWGKWQGYQLPVSDRFVCIWTPIGTPMHWKPGTWISTKHALAFFFPDEWYTMHMGYHEDGSFASGYCDIILPTPHYTSESRELTYVDLYVDVVIREDGSVYTKDQEVFDRAALRYPVVEQARQQSFMMLDQIEQDAKRWTGPFTVMPRHLLRTNFEQLSPAEARVAYEQAMA